MRTTQDTRQAMRCPRCKVPLTTTGEVIEGRARQTWEQCPVCGLRHTVSRPNDQATPRRVRQGYRFSAGHAFGEPNPTG